MKRIPISVARKIAKEYDGSVVCIVAWDGKTGMQHVTTYGISKQECVWAADLGNKIKKDILKWPEEECQARPARLKVAEKEVICETCGTLMVLPKGSRVTECSKCAVDEDL